MRRSRAQKSRVRIVGDNFTKQCHLIPHDMGEMSNVVLVRNIKSRVEQNLNSLLGQFDVPTFDSRFSALSTSSLCGLITCGSQLHTQNITHDRAFPEHVRL